MNIISTKNICEFILVLVILGNSNADILWSNILFKISVYHAAQLAGAVEFTDCTSAEG